MLPAAPESVGALPDSLPDPLPPLNRILITIGVLVLSWAVGALVGTLTACAIWQVPVSTATFVIQNPSHYPFARGFTLVTLGVSHLLMFIVSVLLMLYVTVPQRYLRPWLRERFGGPLGRGPLLAMAVMLASLPAMTVVVVWNQGLHFTGPLAGFDHWARAQELQLKELTEMLTRQRSLSDLLSSLLVIAILPAIGEELTFRGILQPTLTRLFGSRTVAIWAGAVLFSAIHMQFFGFVPRLLLGALFGYLFAWSGRLWVPIAAHLLNNGLQVLLLYLYQHGHVTYDVNTDRAAPWPWVVASVLATAALLFVARRYLLTHSAPPLPSPAPGGSRFRPDGY